MSRAVLGLAALAMLACSAQPQGGSRAASGPRATSPAAVSPSYSLAPPRQLRWRVDTVVSGLVAPWEIAFLPDGGVLITERPGRVRVVANGQLQAQPALTVSVVQGAGLESGLLGMALHPRFPNPPDVYLAYTYSRAGGNFNRVSRFRYADGRLSDERVVLNDIPGGGCCHFGGRIRFGPDGLLYVTVGDAQQPGRAADRSSLNGKVLRLRDDGSIPQDNPFPGSPVYAWGLRNPEGLAWDPSGRLYASVHGPTGDLGLCCHDEIDLIRAGAFYGWPVKAGNSAAGNPGDYGNPPERVPPVAESGSDTWAPAGMTFFSPDPKEQSTLLVATLRGAALRRFVIDPAQPERVSAQEIVLSGQGRLRDAVTGPDGCVYVLTSNRDGRGQPQAGDDRVLKLCA